MEQTNRGSPGDRVFGFAEKFGGTRFLTTGETVEAAAKWTQREGCTYLHSRRQPVGRDVAIGPFRSHVVCTCSRKSCSVRDLASRRSFKMQSPNVHDTLALSSQAPRHGANQEDRLGPGGLDPVEVFEALPEALQRCFKEGPPATRARKRARVRGVFMTRIT